MGKRSELTAAERCQAVLSLLRREEPAAKLARRVKEEEIYWRLYDRPAHCRECLEEFRERYNRRRPHWALIPESGGDPLVPQEVYRGDRKIRIPRWQGWAKGAKEKLDRMLAEAA